MFNKDHYVPIIRWKRGEQTALIELEQEIKNGMTPLIEIPPIDWDFKNKCFKKSIDDHLKNFALQIKTSWSNPNKLFIDAFQVCINDDVIMANGGHPLEYIFHLLSEEGIEAIPVTSKNRGDNYQKAINSVLQTYNTGFAIRLTKEDFNDIDSNTSWFINQFDCSPAETDIFIDYKYIDSKKSPVEMMVNSVADSMLTLPHINQWRTLTFAATTFPENLSEFPSGKDGHIPRNEWLIYKQILKNKLPRHPAFGDYIISNPEYPKIDPRIMNMSANIRYTTNDEYLIFRGYSVKTEKHGKWKQAQALCQRIVSHSKYSGLHYSYGDNYIYDCANGNVSTGGPERWRTVGTNHHLTLARNELSNFHATLVVDSQ